MDKDVIKYVIGFCLVLCAQGSLMAQDILQTRISVQATNTNLVSALDQISASGDFSFVYNSDIIDQEQLVSLNSQNQPVKEVLDGFLADDFTYLVRGRYIILQPVKPTEKVTYQLKGELRDASTGGVITEATIVEVGKLTSSISDDQGNYDLSVASKTEAATFIISKENYRDTIIQITNIASREFNIQLTPVSQAEIKPTKIAEPVESRRWVKFLVSKKNRKNTKNVDYLNSRPAQISLVPVLGTNRQMGGSITNNLSFNILAGYAYGVQGLEMGGLANIIKEDVDGVQIAGMVNTVGGTTQGLQMAGFVNTTIGAVSGTQLAGFANYVADSVAGFQGAGFFNIAKTNRVVQAAGFFNMVYQHSRGLQMAGFFNYARSNKKSVQASGFVNLTVQDFSGVQVTGFANRSKILNGTQVSGFLNTTGKMSGAQITGFVNMAGDMSGTQVAGFLNIAKKVKGVQVGLLNIADTVERGATIGLINFVKKGFTHLELNSNDIMPIGVSFKSGTHKFYSIINAGIRPQSNLWAYGLGVGTQFNLGKVLYTSLEANWNQIDPLDEFVEDLNFWTRYKLNFGARLSKNISIYGGPSFNTYISRLQDPDTGVFGYDLGIDPISEKVGSNRLRQSWIGFQGGIRF